MELGQLLKKAQENPDSLTTDETVIIQAHVIEALQNKIFHIEKAVLAVHEDCIRELQKAVIELREQLNVIKGVEEQVNPSVGGIYLG